MKIHPKIYAYTQLIKNAGINDVKNNEQGILKLLKEHNASQTEAIIVLHLGFNSTLEDSEKIVYSSEVWENEPLQDIAFQTFLYMNYNPDDPDFRYDGDTIKFSLFPPSKGEENPG